MIGYYLSSNNEMCYSTKNQTFLPTKHTRNIVADLTYSINERNALLRAMRIVFYFGLAWVLCTPAVCKCAAHCT